MASALILLAATSQSAEVKTGGAKMIEVDGKYHVWTKRVGHGSVTMLTLHGGPGFPHDYFECFEDFLPQHGIQFYYYDQLGVGNSEQPDDVSLWTVARYRAEVEQVRKGLGLDHFYLYGHSWGGMLAIEYALEHQDHLKALIISDMTAGTKAYGIVAINNGTGAITVTSGELLITNNLTIIGPGATQLAISGNRVR